MIFPEIINLWKTFFLFSLHLLFSESSLLERINLSVLHVSFQCNKEKWKVKTTTKLIDRLFDSTMELQINWQFHASFLLSLKWVFFGKIEYGSNLKNDKFICLFVCIYNFYGFLNLCFKEINYWFLNESVTTKQKEEKTCEIFSGNLPFLRLFELITFYNV